MVVVHWRHHNVCRQRVCVDRESVCGDPDVRSEGPGLWIDLMEEVGVLVMTPDVLPHTLSHGGFKVRMADTSWCCLQWQRGALWKILDGVERRAVGLCPIMLGMPPALLLHTVSHGVCKVRRNLSLGWQVIARGCCRRVRIPACAEVRTSALLFQLFAM